MFHENTLTRLWLPNVKIHEDQFAVRLVSKQQVVSCRFYYNIYYTMRNTVNIWKTMLLRGNSMNEGDGFNFCYKTGIG